MTWFDTTLMRWVAANRFPIGDQLAHGIMSLSTNLVILAVATLLGLVYVVARHRYRLAVSVAIAVVASTLIAGLLKQILGRAVWVHPRARRLAGVILAAGVVALGLCLIYLGVHWPTDVFAGWALGVGVGASTAAMITPRRWRRAGQLHHIDDRPEGAVR